MGDARADNSKQSILGSSNTTLPVRESMEKKHV